MKELKSNNKVVQILWQMAQLMIKLLETNHPTRGPLKSKQLSVPVSPNWNHKLLDLFLKLDQIAPSISTSVNATCVDKCSQSDWNSIQFNIPHKSKLVTWQTSTLMRSLCHRRLHTYSVQPSEAIYRFSATVMWLLQVFPFCFCLDGHPLMTCTHLNHLNDCI